MHAAARLGMELPLPSLLPQFDNAHQEALALQHIQLGKTYMGGRWTLDRQGLAAEALAWVTTEGRRAVVQSVLEHYADLRVAGSLLRKERELLEAAAGGPAQRDVFALRFRSADVLRDAGLDGATQSKIVAGAETVAQRDLIEALLARYEEDFVRHEPRVHYATTPRRFMLAREVAAFVAGAELFEMRPIETRQVTWGRADHGLRAAFRAVIGAVPDACSELQLRP